MFDVDEDASIPIQQVGEIGARLISSAGYSLTYDTRNNRLNPSRGLFLALTQELAGLGGDANYLQTVAEARGYYPIYEGITGRALIAPLIGYGGVGSASMLLQWPRDDPGFDTSVRPRAFGRTGRTTLSAVTYSTPVARIPFPTPFFRKSLLSGASSPMLVSFTPIRDASILTMSSSHRGASLL